MDYQRMSLERLQRLDVTRSTQIKTVASAARRLLATKHHSTLAKVMEDLNQERVEIRYWIRVKSGRIGALHERTPADANLPTAKPGNR